MPGYALYERGFLGKFFSIADWFKTKAEASKYRDKLIGQSKHSKKHYFQSSIKKKSDFKIIKKGVHF